MNVSETSPLPLRARRRAAALLLAARHELRPIPALPEDCRPAGLTDAYAIQDTFRAELGGTLAGFKIGATNQAARDLLAVETQETPTAFAVPEAKLPEADAEAAASMVPELVSVTVAKS